MIATEEVLRLVEGGEIVITTIRKVAGYCAFVMLDDYGIKTRFVHFSEITARWIRNAAPDARPKQTVALKIVRVNRTRSELDTSLKRVSGEKGKSKVIEMKKHEKWTAFFEFIKSKLGFTKEQVAKIKEKILEKRDCVFDPFEAVVRKGPEAIQNLDLSLQIVQAIEEETTDPIPQVEARGVTEMSSKKPDGIQKIMSTLAYVKGNKESTTTTLTYLGAPRYGAVESAENFKDTEESMNAAVEKIRIAFEKQHDPFCFMREESMKSHASG